MTGNGALGRRSSTRETRRTIFAEAAEILETEFSRPIQIDEVARRVATSQRQLQRVFAEVGGLGFRAHLTGIRMARAAELLTTTDIPVKAIARQVGYDDPSRFSKAFRHARGVCPSSFREESSVQLPEVDASAPAVGRSTPRTVIA